MTDHYHQQQWWAQGDGNRENDHHRGAGDYHHHSHADGDRLPRRPGKKFPGFRKYGGRPELGPHDNRTTTTTTPPLLPPQCYDPFRRYDNGAETCEKIEWKTMAKHFSGVPQFINENAEKFKNGYSQSNIPQNHHLQYYSDLHKLHQATRNIPRKISLQQSCCKPWHWNGGSLGTAMNSFYFSDPKRYDEHAKQIVQDDSKIKIDETDQLSLSVWCKYSANRQSEDVYDMKMALWHKLSALIKSQAPGCGLYLVGSTMNGFGCDVSDADFCLLSCCTSAAGAAQVTSDSVVDQSHRDERYRVLGVQRLRWLMGLLERERTTVRTTDARIVYAKVPILKFRWNDGRGGKIDVDLCCNNVGIRNTHLLYCYSRLDYRVRPLVLTIKLWASYHNINDPIKMTLSSYSLVLMAINFLQCVKPPVLPSLQRIYGMKFSSDTNIEFVHMHEQLPTNSWRSENQQSLGELLLKFFEYYNDFNYCQHAVSVRMGTPIPLEHCRLAETIKNDPGQWKFIGIEEPFERTNTARSVHNHNIFTQIKDVINKSYTTLKETMSLNSIFCELEN
ncbi:poly(A) RNA polymerase gld-2 homolog A-like isoform X2 [Sipha flava]|uniref:Poly(A) RNA polymerase gld-2 homolog A-like isoform X2 n=1 Tax=Sipha flava TaxID=143950 RepID=A0A8B8FWX8_9HEMI|nr:poly(A) RNA polymerase gld-2 homolog A-like isoform X2 [Sipha flava]